MVKPRLSYVEECQDTGEKVELLLLANKCRSLASLTDDESTVQSLNRLADDFETKAKTVEYLDALGWSGEGMPSPSSRQGAN